MGVTLYPHQEKALNETKQFNKVGYFLDMGLGKTFVGSEKMLDLHCDFNLLICQKSKIDDWIEHFEMNYPDYLVFDLTTKKGFEGFFECYENSSYYENIVGVINYELTFRRERLLDLDFFTLMLDESSLITNPSAKRTKFVDNLNPDNVILLSGTPTGGKYEKLWSQLHLLGWNISKELFYKQYVVEEWIEDGDSGFKMRVIVGYKNVDRLKAKLKQYGCIFMKTEEVFDLPEQIVIPVMVSNTKEFRYFMRNSIVTIEDKKLIGDTRLTKRMYARQLCGQYSKAKLTAFQNLVESTDDRLIVFYNFNEELSRLKAIVEEQEKPISIVNGSVKDLTAYENNSDSVTFVQYQAGAKGLNLQKANKIIYFTLPQNPEDFEQSKKRIHRIGQKNNCFYYYLMVRNSVDEDILETLKMRKEYDDELFKKYEETF